MPTSSGPSKARNTLVATQPGRAVSSRELSATRAIHSSKPLHQARPAEPSMESPLFKNSRR